MIYLSDMKLHFTCAVLPITEIDLVWKKKKKGSGVQIFYKILNFTFSAVILFKNTPYHKHCQAMISLHFV